MLSPNEVFDFNLQSNVSEDCSSGKHQQCLICSISCYVLQVKISEILFTQKMLRYVSYLIYSSTLWVKYGLVKEASFLVNVNSIGAFLNFLFAFIYYIYTSQKVCKSHHFAILSLVLATFLHFVSVTTPQATNSGMLIYVPHPPLGEV